MTATEKTAPNQGDTHQKSMVFHQEEKIKLLSPKAAVILKQYLFEHLYLPQMNSFKSLKQLDFSKLSLNKKEALLFEQLESEFQEYLDDIRYLYLDGPKTFLKEGCSLVARVGKKMEKSLSLEKILSELTLRSNEFACVFDIDNQKLTPMDDRVEDVLAISEGIFSENILWGAKNVNLYTDERDMPHIMRYMALGIITISTPGMTYEMVKDGFSFNYRLNTDNCFNADMQKLKQVMIHQRNIPVYEKRGNSMILSKLLCIMEVRDVNEFRTVYPRFNALPMFSSKMNTLLYLYNSIVLDLSYKFILMLNEKYVTDRSRHVCENINKKLKQYGINKFEYTEGKVSDCFGKTIRLKLAQAVDEWQMNQNTTKYYIDREAVIAAEEMGLIPLPPVVEHLTYQLMQEG